MNILFLGYADCKLLNFLKSKYDVNHTNKKISLEHTKNIDFIISFGYRYIITDDIINKFKNKIVNLHISYLPYNKGSHPNFWSFVNNTPSGISIHEIDSGIDTGDIIIQKEIELSCDLTFRESYNILYNEIQLIFIQNETDILHNKIKKIKQPNIRSIHYKKDLDKYQKFLTNGWDTNIKTFIESIKHMKRTDLEIINEIQQIRSKNNVNWMDILRIAFKHAPEETRNVFKKITEDDNKINNLSIELSNNN